MLDKNVLSKILGEWSYWDRPIPKSIPRSPLGFPCEVPADLVISIQGIRRSGKSTFLGQIVSRFNLNPKHCFFINFEDPRLSHNLTTNLLQQISDLALKRVGGGQPVYLFLDEIQNIKDWEKWINLKISVPGRARVVITGSNASLLSGDLGTVLTGRHLTVEIFPFDFFEFRQVKPGASLADYLHQGGFPRPLTFENPQQLMREYFSDIIEKDVRRNVAARSSTMLQQFVKAVFESAGSELSMRKLARTLGLSADTVGQYMAACESAYLVLTCPYFSFSERKRKVRNIKYYPIDTGLKNSVITRGGVDLGKDFETVVFAKLRKLAREIFYWRKNGEVDFVVQTGEGVLPIQVSWDAIKDRHRRAVAEFTKSFPNVREPLYISRDNVEEFLGLDASLSKASLKALCK